MVKKLTKIVCTLGPASDDKETIKKLYEAGMNVARLNFSHGDYDYFSNLIKNIREVSEDIAILLDTKGPEVRTGKIKEGTIELEDNDEFVLTKEKIEGDKAKVSIDYDKLDKVEVGNRILIDDGLIECVVLEKVDDGLKVQVLNGGVLGSNKTVSIRGHNVEIPFLLEKDVHDIEFGIKHNVAFVAASFVRQASEILELRKLLNKHNSKIKIISKIEHEFSVKNFDEILEVSDGIMVARGDLGVEMPLEKVPKLQFDIIKKCRLVGKPVIVATQMLESMKDNPRPTRAEVSDVAQAIMQGTDAIMLSGETASGKYPVKAVEMMSKIAEEYDLKVQNGIKEELKADEKDISLFITHATYLASKELSTKALLIPTESGFTARHVSKFRPKCPIYALSGDIVTVRQLQLSWGVTPFYNDKKHESRDDMVNDLVLKVYDEKFVSEQDRVVVTAGLKLAKKGYTNLMEIYRVQEVLERI